MIDFKEYIKRPEYDFLQTNEHLGKNIILLGLGGSHAYGTNIDTSDVDIRGIALNSKKEILTGADFGNVVNKATDTTIYSFNTMIKYLSSCNPNVIEIIGLEPEDYLYISDIGKLIIDNKDIFLSKMLVHKFLGFMGSQLRKLDNKSDRELSDLAQMRHVLNSIENARYSFPTKYPFYPDDAIKLYVDSSDRKDMDCEIFMDLNLTHYPLIDWDNMFAEMHSIDKKYRTVTKDLKKILNRNGLAKHQMHTVRLAKMAIEILNTGVVRTKRVAEHDFLMSIRNGDYLDENDMPIPAFTELIDDLRNEIDKAAEHSDLPDIPDFEAIDNFVAKVNERIILGDIPNA